MAKKSTKIERNDPAKVAIGLRIRQKREELGLSQSEVAKQVKVSFQSVQQWEGGQTSPRQKYHDALSKALETTASWIMFGPDTSESPETYVPPSSLRKVPIISWVQAGSWNQTADPFPDGGWDEMVTTNEVVGEHTFALVVRGDSMEPEFSHGTVIIVDPSRQAESGDYVVVRLHDSDEATFKQLVIDGPHTYLKPLNERYPVLEVNGEATMCGVVCESRNRY